MKWLSRTLITNPIYIGLATTERQFKSALKKLKIPKNEYPNFLKTAYADATVHYFTCEGKEAAIVCIHKMQPNPMSRIQIDCLLMHEAVHIWQTVRENMGEKYPSREFEAYSIQCIAQNLIVAYHEYH